MTLSKGSANIGFIGLGIMGRSMAGHILDDGWQLHVYNRSRGKAEDLIGRGAVWHDTPGDLAAACDAVITIVGYPNDVEALYLGDEGLLARAKPGTIFIDMTTSSPTLAEQIAAAAAEKGMQAVDAPVSGGDMGARQGKLSIMVGGDSGAFEAVRPLLDLMGGKIILQGPPGAGQHTKMANQIAVACTMLAVCESLAYAKASGLDPRGGLDSIGTGAASSFLLTNLGPRILDGDYAPGFFVHHFIKDMGIAIAEAERLKLDLPGLALAKILYERLRTDGYGEDGTQALFRLYDR